MKLAIATFLPKNAFEISQNQKWLRRRFAATSRLGYEGIELLIENPLKIDVGKLEELAHAYDLGIPAIGTGPTYLTYGLSFADPDGEVRTAAVKRVGDYLAVASNMGALVIIGLVRGKIGTNASYKRAWRRIRRCLSECALNAEDLGVTMVLEPINRYETSLINTIDEASQMVEEVRSDNVKVMADTFHMNIEEASTTEALLKAGKSLAHVHVADSNRLAPGMGHIDFAGMIHVLNEIGYFGYLSAEILFRPNFNVATRVTIEYLKKIL